MHVAEISQMRRATRFPDGSRAREKMGYFAVDQVDSIPLQKCFWFSNFSLNDREYAVSASGPCGMRASSVSVPRRGVRDGSEHDQNDDSAREFNEERPHDALAMKRPADVYAPSPRRYDGRLPDLSYPFHDRDVLVTRAGASGCTANASTSQACLRGKGWESRKSTKEFGSSALSGTISASSIWSRKPCSNSTTHSARGCHLCLRRSMCPGRTKLAVMRHSG